ncbi:TPA: adenine deaminase, partial [Candidatus Micrarchaeota archaeon]|nr:adenine deaminase [Candidatus Micrarchaeota archaeon]
EKPINVFHVKPQKPGDFAYAGPSKTLAIGVKDGSLLTKKIRASSNDWRKPESGINKIAVINRYCNCRPAVAFAKGFGLRRGAFASSVSHDSHNLCAVGADDESLAQAANAVIACKGGLAAFDGTHCRVLRLPFAGLMSGEPCEKIALEYTYLNKMVHSMGCCLRAPFMALSFTTLLSIPELKISDQGLFDSTRFEFVR